MIEKFVEKFIKPSLYKILNKTPKIIWSHCGLNCLKQKEAKESKLPIVYFNNLPQCNAYVFQSVKLCSLNKLDLHMLIFDGTFRITISKKVSEII